jgi:hypothetical protein
MGVARELIHAHRTGSPDGDPVTPYIYFIVRPDGIRPYYEARARLEPLGIAFGYELVDQETEIDFPDFDDLVSWEDPRSTRPGAGTELARGGPSDGPGNADKPFVWPVDRGRSTGGVDSVAGSSNGNGGARGEGPNSYMWPTGPQGSTPSTGGPDGRGNPHGMGGGPGIGLEGSPRTVPGGGSGIDLDGPVPGTGAPPPMDQLRPGRALGGGFGIGDPLGGLGPSGGRPPGEPGGLAPLGADALPGLSPAGDGDGSAGSSGVGAGPSGGVRANPDPNSGLPPLPGGGNGGPNGSPRSAVERVPYYAGAKDARSEPPPPTPPGRVRIDPTAIGEPIDPFGDPPEGETGSPGGGSPTKPNGSGTTRSTQGSPGSAPAAGQDGASGIGLPTAGIRPGDVRPKRASSPAWRLTRETTVDAPLELVVACGADGVVLHPGGYRLSLAAIRKPGELMHDLETIVHNRALIDPTVHPRPRVRFLVEPGGTETFEEARRRTVLSGKEWPVSVQVAGPSAPEVFPKERF